MPHVIITKKFDYPVPGAKTFTVKAFTPSDGKPLTVTRAEADALIAAGAAQEHKEKVNRNDG